ncbi:MAG: hypothetical protein AAF519_09355 [Bacteroidota bacterium]
MQKAWYAIFLVGFACTKDDPMTRSMTGEWEIAWKLNEMTTRGQIEFSEDGNAQVFTAALDNDLLAPGSHHAYFQWQMTPDQLTLERQDSQLELSYDIVSINDKMMELTYADEIQITLVRIR